MEQLLLQCCNVGKSYQNNQVFKNFNYTFKNRGLYVLFGNSGTGKTTLINILLGLTNFDSGTIKFNGKSYTQKVNYNDLSEYISYISQDSYFIDYLSVQDNIKICSPNSNNYEIEKILKKMKLNHKKNTYPLKLSGGERQRLAIAQLLLKKKKILILDEPTSSLDSKNRDLFFEIINELKKEILIICCTHDDKIFEYSDYVIDFNNLNKYKNNDNNKINIEQLLKVPEKSVNDNKISQILKFMLKKDKYENREKKSSIILIFVLVISLLLCFACYGYKEKLFQTLINRYSVNMVKIYCSIDENNYCKDVLKKYNSTYTIYSYSENVPSIEDEVIDGSSSALYFDPTLLTLPSEKQRFQVSDSILYGNYFSESNQVMLGYNFALALSENPEKLIGTEIKINLPDKTDSFIIVGIFNEFVPSEINYLKSVYGDLNYNSYIYINSDYTSKYLYDDQLGYNEVGSLKSTVLITYFNNPKDLHKFYKDFVNKNPITNGISVSDFTSGFVEYEQDIELAKMIFYPLIICILTVSILFYFQIQKTELIYTKHILAVYQYYGFSPQKIKYATMLYSLITVLKKYFISVGLAIILSYILNYFVECSKIVEFKLFMTDYITIALLLIALSIFSIFLSLINYKKVQVKGWFNVLKERSDLL